jgi:hypothetical protein
VSAVEKEEGGWGYAYQMKLPTFIAPAHLSSAMQHAFGIKEFIFLMKFNNRLEK